MGGGMGWEGFVRALKELWFDKLMLRAYGRQNEVCMFYSNRENLYRRTVSPSSLFLLSTTHHHVAQSWPVTLHSTNMLSTCVAMAYKHKSMVYIHTS
jgi:hypothetical protein